MNLKPTLRARLARWSVGLWPLAFAWYRFTQWATLATRKDSRVIRSSSLWEGVQRLGEGEKYRADKPLLDTMTHPRVTQARINRGAQVGDCEDHAAYLLSALLRGSDDYRPCMFAVMMWNPRTEGVEGHVIAGLSLPLGFEVADYGRPRRVYGLGYSDASPRSWSYVDRPPVAVGRYVADAYGNVLLGVSWCPCYRDSRGGIRWNYSEGGHWKNDWA